MAHRVCETCRKAENPLGRLRFNKHIDGIVYCEECLPVRVEVLDPTPPAYASSPLKGTSAGSFVVIRCPDCRSSQLAANCDACANYGSVRIPANFLNVYRPKKNTPEPPETLVG